MGRKPRELFPGAILHVWARRVDRWALFVDEEDYRRYLRLLKETVERFNVAILSFCLMPNHVHLLVEMREANLAGAMHNLHGKYVRRFNKRHDREGRLFESRYRSKLVRDEVYFATVVKYIEQNAVEAALCKTPEDWPWSSRGLLANGDCPDWLANDLLERRRGEFIS